MSNLISGPERRAFKKQLSRMKAALKDLPRLIDCSEVYGDGYYTQEMAHTLENKIKKLEDALGLTISTP